MRKFYLLCVFVACLFSKQSIAQSSAPSITSFSPVSGTYRDTIVVKGKGFLNTLNVTVGGVQTVYYYIDSDTLLHVGIPKGNTGDIVVVTSQGTAVKSGFTYIQPLLVSGFSPAYGAPGATITITGAGFNTDPAANDVYFGSAKATVVTAGTDTLTVIIPAGATSTQLKVMANGTTGYSNGYFVVALPGQEDGKTFAFGAALTVASSLNISGFAAVDLDGDGKKDIAYINKYNFSFSVIKNTGSINTISFAPKADFALVGQPVDIIAGDIDLDGKPDILIKTSQQSLISIFRNTSTGGAISFAQRIDIPAFSYPNNYVYGRTMALADISGDGLPELVTSNGGLQTISVLKNTGSPGVIAFAPSTDFSCDIYPSSLVVTDLDGDGNKDISVMSSGSFFAVFRNTSSGNNISLAPYVYHGAQDFNATLLSMVSGDYNGDGKPDIAAISGPTRRIILFNNTSTPGAVSFSKTEWPFAEYPGAIDNGDFDNDNKTDLIVTNASSLNSFSIFRNTTTGGNSSLALKQDIGTGFAPLFTVTADIDGDNKQDIVTINSDGKNLYIVRNTYKEPFIKSFNPSMGIQGDQITLKGLNFTGVGTVQFGGVNAASFQVENDSTIVAVLDSGATGQVTVSGSAGTGYKTGFVYGAVPVITSFSPLSGAAGSVVTIRGSGFLKTASANTVFFGAVKATVTGVSDTTLLVVVPAGATYKPISVTAYGLTAFSDQRFIVTFTGAADSLTTAAFSDRIKLPAAAQTIDMVSADLDGDGKADLTTINQSTNNLSFYRNTSTSGHLSFAAYTSLATAAYAQHIAFGDVDGDGKPDLIVSTSLDLVVVHRNTSSIGNISFTNGVPYAAGVDPLNMVIRDLDKDGKPEIIIEAYNGSEIRILKNNSSPGTISFIQSIAKSTGSLLPRGLAVDDIDRDGMPDICSASYSGLLDSLFIFSNTSGAAGISFAEGKGFARRGRGTWDVATGDLDGDHIPDILMGNYASNTLSTIRNYSTGGNLALDTVVRYTTGTLPESLILGDIDGDGKADVAVGNGSSNTVSMFKNKSNPGAITLANRFDMASGTFPRALCLGDLDGDGKPDLAMFNYQADSISIFRNKIGEALVAPSGINPVTGDVVNQSIVDSTVQTYNGQPYVQRHYDVTPVNNPATATATITLYFTQQEFDNYNAHPAHGLDLPHNATDNVNKANLRVYQYHGFSTTSLPGTYTGNGVEIDPDDAMIVWNNTTKQWEVTFDVNGFSGFFISSANSSMLPVTLLSFKGNVQGQNAILQWKTTQEINVSYFELQRKTDSSAFSAIAKVKAENNSSLTHDYTYTDRMEMSVAYYRLKMVDADGAFTYSKTIKVATPASRIALLISPNPATDYITVTHPAAIQQATISVMDMAGRVIKSIVVGRSVSQTRLAIKGIGSGTYNIVWKENSSTMSQLLLVP